MIIPADRGCQHWRWAGALTCATQRAKWSHPRRRFRVFKGADGLWYVEPR